MVIQSEEPFPGTTRPAMAQAAPLVAPEQLVDAHELPSEDSAPPAEIAQASPEGQSPSDWQVVQERPHAPQFGGASAAGSWHAP
jgi:hypothetical protein